MKKTLTEQWREHNLKYKQNYYLLLEDGGEDIQPFMGGFFMSESNEVKEVLAPVPSFDEYKELVRKSDKLDKILSDAVTNQGDCQQIVNDNLNRQIERLQEQLNDANEVIKKYAIGEYKVKAPKYVGTCYGTNMLTGEPDKEDLYEGYYFAKVPFANNTKPATAYLKKWGVK